jgi:NAD dependent epimerase/dehydratase
MKQFKKILVTGADGFIGSHLVEKLTRDGYLVRAFTFYNSFNSWGWLDYCLSDVKGKFEVFPGDIRDPYCVRSAMMDCDAVIHLAALIAIPYSYRSPDSYVDTNIKGTLNVLQAARGLGVSRFVHTSTSEVYGTAKFVPMSETHPLKGQSPYSATKIAADQLAYAFYASFGLPVITVRPFNTYGPRQSLRAVIPTIITQVAAGERYVKLGSLQTTRDFSFVEDTVAGFLAALESPDGVGEVFNIGSSFEVTVEDTAKMIASLLGKTIELVSEKDRMRPQISEVERLWADTTNAKTIIKWKPNYSGIGGFKSGLLETINWFSNPENLRLYKSGTYTT